MNRIGNHEYHFEPLVRSNLEINQFRIRLKCLTQKSNGVSIVVV